MFDVFGHHALLFLLRAVLLDGAHCRVFEDLSAACASVLFSVPW